MLSNYALKVDNLNFNTAHSYTIDPGTGGTLTPDDGTASAAIMVAGGSHFIPAPMFLYSTANVTIPNAGDSLGISGSMSLAEPQPTPRS
jgi:hypothetical protein